MTSDSELLQLAIDGDESAFVRLVETKSERLRRMIEMRLDHRLRARCGVSDIIQETWVTAFSRLQDFAERRPGSLYVWLRSVARERIIDAWRTHAAEKRSVMQEERAYEPGVGSLNSLKIAGHLVDSLSSPSQRASRKELLQSVEAELDQMSDVDREVLILRHLEELNNAETAQVLGISESAASTRHLRALARLQQRLRTLPAFEGYWAAS